MRDILIAAGAGLLSFVFLGLVAVGPGGALFGALSPLPLFAVGLTLGVTPTMIAGATLMVVAAGFGGAAAAMGALAVLAGPVLLLVRQALLSRPAADGATEWYPPGLLVAWLTLIGLGLVALTLIVVSTIGEGALVTRLTAELIEALKQMLPDTPTEKIETFAQGLAPYAIGFSTLSWLLVLAMNGALAQGLVGRMGKARRPAPDIAELELPRWIAAALAIGLVGAYFAPGDLGFAAQNFATVLLLPFFFAGLAVVHALVRKRAARGILLAVFYGAIVLFTWLVIPVTGLGLLDQLVGLRRRFIAGPHDREDE
jgi:hypothetical protein